jgi:hypothetical protein
MGRQGDYSKREKKKGKKEAKKIAPVTIIAPPLEVEVIRKGKMREGRRPEEEEE